MLEPALDAAPPRYLLMALVSDALTKVEVTKTESTERVCLGKTSVHQ